MGTHYVTCSHCEAGIDLDTGDPCERCDGRGGVWVLVEAGTALRIEILTEPPDGDDGERLRPDGEEGA